MERLWLYKVLDDALVVVKADDKKEAEQKVQEAYKKDFVSLSEYPIIIKAYNEENNWFADLPDVLEVYG